MKVKINEIRFERDSDKTGLPLDESIKSVLAVRITDFQPESPLL